MAESVIKLGRKLRGIRDQNIYKNYENQYNAGTEQTPEHIASDARKIKNLEDQINNLEKELQKSREDSFQAGYDEGKQRTFQEAQNQIEAVNNEMKQVELRFTETIEQMETPLLGLAKEMAKEVIQQEIKLNDEIDTILIDRLSVFLHDIIEQNNIIIEANPQQLGILKDKDVVEKLGLSEKKDVKIVGNDSLKPGETHIETEDYFIDGSFDNHVDKIRNELTKGSE
jgi:flagellar assembly protein FliH